MQGRDRVGHAGVGWVMQGWDGSCRVGWVMQGWGGVGHTGVGWIIQGWDDGWSYQGGVGITGY